MANTNYVIEKTKDFTFRVIRVTSGDLDGFVQNKDIKEFRVWVADFAYHQDAVEYVEFKNNLMGE